MHFISICTILPSGAMILTNLPSFCVRKLSCKIQLFWASKFSGRRFLNDPTPLLHFCLKRTWPFNWTNLNSLHLRIICFKFDWFWSAGSEEEDFYNFSLYFYSMLLHPLGEGQSPLFKKKTKNLNPLPPRMTCAKSG
jgi:hypothetical protein